MQNIIDFDTAGYEEDIGGFYNFHVNNTFYLLSPYYYRNFYSVYLRKALCTYDGWIDGYHNKEVGIIPQGLLQSIARGLNNMVFAHGIDFCGDGENYNFAVKWANETNLYEVIKKAHIFDIAGGTSLLKLNRHGTSIYATTHRIDTFFPDIASDGSLLNVKVYFDIVTNTNATGKDDDHFGICEERYFNEEGKACIKCSVYKATTLQNEPLDRPLKVGDNKVNWENLPSSVKKYIKSHYPSVIIDKEQYLPFAHSLGCYLLKFTESIPRIPDSMFGQPIGDILNTESRQYDQMKYFELNEVDLARARALIPEEMWNKDDPDYDKKAMSERFYEKVGSINSDTDKITPIQFLLRGNDIRTQKENIYKDISLKLMVSASSVASFLNEGSGAKTATEIMNERTKTDTWISSQIGLISPPINEMLKDVMRYYNQEPVKIIFKSEDQSPLLETVKIYTDMRSAGAISNELFVKKVHKNLTEEQQKKEIDFLNKADKIKEMQALAYVKQSIDGQPKTKGE